MEWYAWLRRAGLAADVASQYALLFARSGLGAADVRRLDHGMLVTVGVAVAKHRLEILKLARKESASASSVAVTVLLPWRATRLLAAAAHRSVRSLMQAAAGCLVQQHHPPARRDRVSAALAPSTLLRHQYHRSGGSLAVKRRKISAPTTPTATTVAACRRRGIGSARKQLAFLLARVSKPMLMLTANGASAATRGSTAGAAAGCFASSHGYDADEDDDDDDEDMADGEGEEEEEMRWESMFEDLNPT